MILSITFVRCLIAPMLGIVGAAGVLVIALPVTRLSTNGFVATAHMIKILCDHKPPIFLFRVQA